MNNQSNIKKMFDKYADKYQEQYMDIDLYKNSLNQFCAALTSPNASVLEIGCGPGNITKYLLSKRPDFNILGIDLAPRMIALAQKNNPNALFRVMNGCDILKLNTTYHAIMCGFFLPYLSKQEAINFISDAATVLKKEGLLYLSTMEDLNANSTFQGASHDKNDQLFINYHEADYLRKALLQNGFEIITLTQQDYPQKDGTTTTDLIIIAQNKL